MTLRQNRLIRKFNRTWQLIHDASATDMTEEVFYAVNQLQNVDASDIIVRPNNQ